MGGSRSVKYKWTFFFTIGIVSLQWLSASIGPSLEVSSPVITSSVVDTFPIKDRQGDFLTDPYRNPFDITPSIIEQTVEYDFEVGKYVVMEKIGNEYYRTPTYLTMEEYLEWQRKKQEKDYLNKLSGIKNPDFTRSLKLDPMAEVDIEALLQDRLFGGTDITIKPTGNIDLTLGGDYQRVQNPNLSPRAQQQGGIDFDMDINMGVEGKIGDKMNLGFNYNTQASFDFDNRLNLGYLSDAFDEDDIIKSIEAGNVSMPLKTQLIQGPRNLFGLKTELQFGKFFLTAIASQNRSEAKQIKLENGKQIQEFNLRPDDYDENRHFFLSHYDRDNYEEALLNAPQIRSLKRITNLEVWVTIDQNADLRNAATVAAIADLGESNTARFNNPATRWQPVSPGTNLMDIDGRTLPENDNSDLFRALINDPNTRKIINIANNLQRQYDMTQVRDFEVQSMRKLDPSEYTLYPQLGFISLRTRLRPNQVLGVSFEYTYSINGNEIYKVGELTNESNRGGISDQGQPEPEDVVYVKMLKSSNQVPGNPSWDLMMKNIYSLNTAQLTQDQFQFDIFYEDFANAALLRYIPEASFRNIPLLNFFQLDRLNAYGDPQEDGIFDFVPGITVNPSTGSVIFPVLEPFGSSLFNLFGGNQQLFDKYGFPELYNNTVTQARQTLDKNRFLIKGELKSNLSSEISLGAFNIPRGSVTVRAGSQLLREGIDYEIDYGIGRLKILNESYLQAATPIIVQFENQGLFNLQQKTMLGLRGEFRFNENASIGATYMRLFQRPLTQKVNIGEDPINNRMFGLDFNYTTESQFLTNVVDALPFISTNAKSSFNVSAEFAALKPGQSRAINAPGEDEALVSIDDFEGAVSSIALGARPNLWSLASTPSTFPESELNDNLLYGANRALLNWYVVDDRRVRTEADRADPYSRLINQDELFDRDIDITQIPDLFTFDINYYPEERGPYNFDLPGGTPFSSGVEYDQVSQKLKLLNPRSRWGGIMRFIPNNDFELANYEYIEFWMLNPFMARRDSDQPANENGLIVFNLGNVSEDIMKDGLQFYENSIPTPGETIPEQPTSWGKVPLKIPNVKGFDLQYQALQDKGLDGMDDDEERIKFAEYINAIETNLQANVSDDPANDNFKSYLSPDFSSDAALSERYRLFNHPQGNAPIQNDRIGLGNPVPDSEDINDNRSLEQSESYYEYQILISNDDGKIRRAQNDFITDERILRNPTTGEEEIWYRYQVPIMTAGNPVGGIQGFRSIQFIRMYMTGFRTPKTFRLAEFELVRNQWRRLAIDPSCLGDAPRGTIDFIVNEVGLQRNGTKQPFNYVLPRGIKQERIFNTFNNLLQDENSMNINLCNFPDSCEAMISKLTELDIRLFKKLQMFVHAENKDIEPIEDGDLSVFVRLGKDFYNNYYEYEVPLTLSDSLLIKSIDKNTNFMAYSDEVWRPENMFDVDLSLFTEVKMERNTQQVAIADLYELMGGDPSHPTAKVKIKGNPSLGYIKGIIIGVRNNSKKENPLCAEVWINELRLQGLENNGGTAGIARMDLQLADLGNITMSGNFSTIGFGQIEDQLKDRRQDRLLEYDIATNLQLGRFFPSKLGLNIPFYYQFSRSISDPRFDAFELDLTKEQLLENPNLNDDQRTDINERSREITTTTTLNFTNVRKERTKQGTPMPWDISNVGLTYSHSRTRRSDPIIKNEIADDQRADINYGFNAKPMNLQPFKGIKSKALRFIKEINFNPIPNSLSFNSQMRRFKSNRLFRLPDPKEGFEYVFDDQRFDWTRSYALSWDLTKALKLNYNAVALSIIDEYKQVGVAPTADERRWEDPFGVDVSDQVMDQPGLPNQYRNNNLRDLGRIKNYTQGVTLNYTLPLRYIPGMDWITARAAYNGDFTWSGASLNAISLGNVIQNSQSRSVNTAFDFKKLYDKLNYFKNLDGKNVRGSSRSSRGSSDSPADRGTDTKRSEGREISGFEKLFVRPLLSLRQIRFNYRENLSTAVPGFVPSPRHFGMAGGAPGWGFVFGLQPDLNINNQNNFLRNASEQGWISADRFQNQQILQNTNQTFEADIELEPWKDFRIDVKLRKTLSINHVEDFLNVSQDPLSPDFQQLALRDIGSFDVTYSGLNTLFNDDIDGLFRTFESNRIAISNRLPNNTTDPHATDNGYAQGYGRQQAEVLIPAFIAAYTGQDPNATALDIVEDVSNTGYFPKPNWNLNYNGLSKLPGFKEIFSSFTLKHGYKSSLSVSRFSTDLQFQPNDPYFIDPDVATFNYFARFEIPEIIINEQFQPILGINFKTVNNLNMNLEYAKSRNLQFSTGLGQLTEGRSTEYTIGAGWTFNDVVIGFLSGGRKKRPSRNRDPENTEGGETPESPANQGLQNNAQRLVFAFNLQIRDDVTFIHELDDGATKEPTRGLKSLRINPTIDYDINKNFTLRFFVEYNKTQPYLSTSFPITNVRGGLTARFNLN